MDILIKYGFTIEEVKTIMDTNKDIDTDLDNLFREQIKLLENIDCSLMIIKNIIICNPFYLTRKIEKVRDLIDKLNELGFSHLDSLFDSNPYLLNISNLELEELYLKKEKEGLKKDEIIDYFNSFIVF